MPGAGRLGDKANISADAHGCPGCPHPGTGPAIAGSADVFINSLPAVRVDDVGIHAACCGPNMWKAQKGSQTVFINGKAAHRLNDATKHCGGSGTLIEGSSDVIIGDAGGGGGGGSGNDGSGSGSSTAASGASQGGQGGSGSGSSQAGGGAGGGGAASSSPAQQNQSQSPAQQQPPQPATANWKVQYEDGSSVTGITSKYDGPPKAQDVQGGTGNISGLTTSDSYSVSIVGTTKAEGKVTDEDGKGIAGAKVKIERAFGKSVELTTDASGKFTTDGFVGEEPYEITVTAAPLKAQGKFVDENEKPLGGVTAKIVTDGGKELEVTSKGDGTYEAEGLMPGEGYTLEIISGQPK